MRYPTVPVPSTSRQVIDAFQGYNHNLRIADGEFYDMRNMSSDYYPMLAPRKKRGVYAAPEAAQGLIAKESLCYADGSAFVVGDQRIEMGLSTAAADCPKKLVSMGTYVIILPDKKYINTVDTEDHGSIEAEYVSTDTVSFDICTLDDPDLRVIPWQNPPANPDNMDYWIDPNSRPYVLMQYSAASGQWVSVANTYIRISATGIGKQFSQYDGVTISGVAGIWGEELNGDRVIMAVADNYIIVTGRNIITYTQKIETGAVTIARKMPVMDFLVESGNRLWGCHYGIAENGEMVNELYASQLGNFKNWKCFMGLSTDSYAATIGTDGPFTGAISHGGYPRFFKEEYLHTVYGSYPANFQIQTLACRGVQQGCERSLVTVNGVLYYKARQGICAYDGSLPTEISTALGEEAYRNAVAGAIGNKYYISMEDSQGKYHLFVCDLGKGMWHKEDDLRAEAFCGFQGELYCIQHGTGKILTMLGSGDRDTEKVEWMAQTGVIGTQMPDTKYISRLLVRMSMELGSRVRFYAQYDSSGSWEHLGTVNGTNLRTFLLPVRPKRCDHMRLRIEGTGEARIYAITKTIEGGSDIP